MRNQEQAFLRTIRSQPKDGIVRLVYADWLDERSDPRSEYLRLLCAANGWSELTTDRDEILTRLQYLNSEIDSDWLKIVQRGVNWRTLFEVNLPLPEQRQYGGEYYFEPPATAEQLAAAEQILGFRLPDDIREVWSEFNGIRSTTRSDRKYGLDPEWFYLDVQSLANSQGDLREFAPESFIEGEWHKLVLLHASDGWAYLWAICVEDVTDHPAGTVVQIDHDTHELIAHYPNLFEFVRGFHW